MSTDHESPTISEADRDLREARRLEAFERVLDRMARISQNKRGNKT